MKCAEDGFLVQGINELRRGDTVLELLLTNKEELVEGIKAEGSPGCSDYEMLEFKTERSGKDKEVELQPHASGEQILASSQILAGSNGQLACRVKGHKKLVDLSWTL